MAYPKGTPRPLETRLKMAQAWLDRERQPWKRKRRKGDPRSVTVKFDASEYEKLVGKSRSLGMNTSSWLRMIAGLKMNTDEAS